MSLLPSYDCIILGGGPAGATAAAIVAQAGFSTLLVEREKFPRFHIGESLMPETYWPLARIGVLDRMKASHHTQKYSVQFVSHTGRESAPFYFFEHDPHECSNTWQVRRSEFDQMLFDNAAAKGAHCHDATRVLEVAFDGDRATGVTLQTAAGETRHVAAQVVIDATGQSSLIANRLGLRVTDPDLKKSAIWTYYRGAQRDTGHDAGATMVMHTRTKDCWFWYIPLDSDETSVGVVGDHELLLKGRGTPEEVFREELANCPAAQARVAGAEISAPFRVAKEFTYASRRAAGDGWVLVGDAFAFIDPIYSSGVFFALKSAELAADCVVAGLRAGDTSAATLGRWAPGYLGGVRWVRKLVNAFYTKPFSFGAFMKEHPHHKGNLVDLLIGRIFHPEAGAIFDDLDPWLAKACAMQDHDGAACSM